MSVRFHEAFSLDSARRQFNFFEHFFGDSLRDLWAVTGVGSAAVVDAQDGGVIRLTTGATANNQYNLNWGDMRTLHINKKVTIETRLKAITTTTQYIFIELMYDQDNFVGFWVLEDGNWKVRSENGGIITDLDSGIDLDGNFHVFRIECFPVGEVHFYIDDVECGNSPITTNIPSDAADYLQPLIRITTRENVAKSMDIDYVVVRQER